jgi:hypothetical protein
MGIESCPPDASRLAYALVFRGEAYRSGCASKGVRLQDEMMRSQRELLSASLEACGATVDALFPIDARGCANATLRARLYSWWPQERVKLVQSVNNVTTQPQSIRAVLNIFLPLSHSYDVLVLTRYDLRLFQPLLSWPGCKGLGSIGIAQRCEALQWSQWNCTSDVLFVVPRSFLLDFNHSVGAEPGISRFYESGLNSGLPQGRYAKVAPNACFSPTPESMPPSRLRSMTRAGHGCWNSLVKRVGERRISICWPGQRRYGTGGRNGG